MSSVVQALLSHVEFRGKGHSDDTLVLVGDLVSKGPDSAAVVAFARKLGALSVRGNHDDSALAAWRCSQGGKKVTCVLTCFVITHSQPSICNSVASAHCKEFPGCYYSNRKC